MRTEAQFRQHLVDLRLQDGGSSQKRAAAHVLLMGTGAIPNREGIATLCKRDLMWIAEKWCEMYSAFCGDNTIVLADLMPGPETKPGKVTPKIPMPEGRRFIGVYPTASGRWMASIEIGGRGKSLGVFTDPHEAALEYDKAARANPLKSGKPRRLNFTVPPLACTPEPRTRQISLKVAA